jgi:hypothetical protein
MYFQRVNWLRRRICRKSAITGRADICFYKDRSKRMWEGRTAEGHEKQYCRVRRETTRKLLGKRMKSQMEIARNISELGIRKTRFSYQIY